jgi:hypothetical protein
MSRTIRTLFVLELLVFAATVLCVQDARANPRPLPFTYETLAKGDTEVEQYFDFVPLRGLDAVSGAQRWVGATQFQAEVEYGVTHKLEFALYATLAPSPGDAVTQVAALTEGNGMKQRLRYRFAEQGELPIDIGVYGELVETAQEFELEAKLVLVKRFGDLKFATNLWVGQEFYFTGARALVLNPTLGVTYQVTPSFHVGIDSWLRREYVSGATAGASLGSSFNTSFNNQAHVYAGPGLLFNLGKVWWSSALYTRFDDFGRTMKPTDSFGNVWFRSIVGIEL